MELRQPIEEWPRPPQISEHDTSELSGGRWGMVPSTGDTEAHYSVEQVRHRLSLYWKKDVLDEYSLLAMLQVQMLLHLYDRFDTMSDDLSTLADDSWEDHHNRPKGWMP